VFQTRPGRSLEAARMDEDQDFYVAGSSQENINLGKY